MLLKRNRDWTRWWLQWWCYTWEHFWEEGECLLICTRVSSCIRLGRKCASDTIVVWKLNTEEVDESWAVRRMSAGFQPHLNFLSGVPSITKLNTYMFHILLSEGCSIYISLVGDVLTRIRTPLFFLCSGKQMRELWLMWDLAVTSGLVP